MPFSVFMPSIFSDLFRLVINLALIFVCYAIGLWLSPKLPFAIPAALIGLFLLLVFLSIKGRVSPSMTTASRPLLNHMALFFVPVVIGVWQFRELLVEHWLAMFLVVVISTTISFVLVTLLAKRCLKDQ